MAYFNTEEINDTKAYFYNTFKIGERYSLVDGGAGTIGIFDALQNEVIFRSRRHEVIEHKFLELKGKYILEEEVSLLRQQIKDIEISRHVIL